MVQDQNSWDEDLIHDIFIERDVNLILLIPLRNSNADSWFWNKEKLGQYTLKSAYGVLQERKMVHQSSTIDEVLKKMWNLKIPLKFKNFLLRVLTGSLPTKDQLIVKRVAVLSACPVCNVDYERLLHIVQYSFACLC